MESKLDQKIIKDLFQFIKKGSYDHQVEGVRKMLENPYFLLADEPGAGKTKQVIDTAQVLFSRDVIERVVVVCPATLKSLWFDPDTGQIAQFLWDKLPAQVMMYHTTMDYWDQNIDEKDVNPYGLKWLITNYEYLRVAKKLRLVKNWVGGKTLLVLDESSYVKTWSTAQTKACRELRKKSSRIILLNGTVVTDSPMDLFAQCNIMSPTILDCKFIGSYKDRYGVLGGFKGKEVVKWKNLDELKSRFKPYYIRRLKENCLDLPEKLPSVKLSCPLTANTWRMYQEMRQDMVAWLESYRQGDKSVARHATTKSIRLSQLTSGYLGGFKDELDPREVGQEKTDFFLKWYRDQLALDPHIKVIVWCRFRQEAKRLHQLLVKGTFKVPEANIGLMMGDQSEKARKYAINLLDPRYSPKDEPVTVVSTLGTGSVGLNLSAAYVSVYLSTSANLSHRLQSEERVYRPGQVNRVTYVDIIAIGPDRQRTFDFWVMKSLVEKTDMASWTLEQWLNVAKAA